MPTPRRAAPALGLALSCLLVVACTGGTARPRAVASQPASAAPSNVTSAASASPLPDPQPEPREHLSDAVSDLLAAEQRGDRAASFLLLSPESRVEHSDVARWTRSRGELAAVTGFRVEKASLGEAGDAAGTVTAIVEHEPALDPFRGLTAARERQRFTGQRSGGGWLVDADPAVEQLLPPDADAAASARRWVTSVVACQQEEAAEQQAVTDLFGSAQGAVGLCGKSGDVVVGPVQALSAGVGSTDLVAQYGSDALVWARVARISAPAAFGVVLAPLGERWEVVGLVD